jgi:hypothetical protein
MVKCLPGKSSKSLYHEERRKGTREGRREGGREDVMCPITHRVKIMGTRHPALPMLGHFPSSLRTQQNGEWDRNCPWKIISEVVLLKF